MAESAVFVPLLLRDQASLRLDKVDKLAVYFGLAISQPSGRDWGAVSDSRQRDETDVPGVISLIFGILAVVCLLMGCFTCGMTYYVAVPFALLGGLVGFFGRGNMRVAGLLLNFLALIPAFVVMMAAGVGVGSVALKNQGSSDTQPSEYASQTLKQDESINKAKAMNQRVQNGEKNPET